MYDGGPCEKCGNRTKILAKVTQVSWFRGDDEVEERIICPVCSGWKTACKVCGKILNSENGLKMHMRDKHRKEHP
jgi:hypothetical protein